MGENKFRLEINDLFVELFDENTRLSNELLVANECLLLLDSYRQCLTSFALNCSCDHNIDFKSQFFDLEEKYKRRSLSGQTVKAESLSPNRTSKKLDNENEGQTTRFRNPSAVRPKRDKRKQYIDCEFNYNEDDMSDNSDNYNEDDMSNNSDNDYNEDDMSNNSDSDYNSYNGKDHRIITRRKSCSSKEELMRAETDANNALILGANIKGKRKLGLRGFRCNYPDCDYGNVDRNEVQSHINVNHKNARPWKCEECDKSFGSRKYMLNHNRAVHRERRYRCDWPECPYETRNFHYLRQHRMRHTGGKPFACNWPDCEKAFVNKSIMRSHVRHVHQQERPYICEWPACGQAFIASTPLKYHLRTHTGEKPFRCEWPGCDVSFTQKPHLRRHTLIHREIRNFACNWPACDRKFRTNWGLKKHLMVHRGDRPYSCAWIGCDRTFTEKKNMERHFVTHKNKSVRNKYNKTDVVLAT